MILQKNAENTMGEVNKQQGSLKVYGNKNNTYNRNQNVTAEVSCTHNEEGKLGA